MAYEHEYKKWLAEKGSELFLQGLFYDPMNRDIHTIIIDEFLKLAQINDGNLFFSCYENIGVKKNSEFALWNNQKSKNREERSGWQSDGCIKNGNEEKIAIVEFKGLQNNYIKNRDISHLIQYLNFAESEKKWVVWICRRTMVEDIVWIAENIKNGPTSDFFDTVNTWNGKPHINGPCLKCTAKKCKDPNDKMEFNKKSQHKETYQTERFREFLLENSAKLRGIMQDRLIVVNLDKQPIKNDSIKIVNVFELYGERKDTPYFMKFLEENLCLPKSVCCE